MNWIPLTIDSHPPFDKEVFWAGEKNYCTGRLVEIRILRDASGEKVSFEVHSGGSGLDGVLFAPTHWCDVIPPEGIRKPVIEWLRQALSERRDWAENAIAAYERLGDGGLNESIAVGSMKEAIFAGVDFNAPPGRNYWVKVYKETID